VLFYACYLPLLLWAPLLAAVTIDFYRRRVTRARGSTGRSWTGTPDTARRAHG
jgi:hypothetical protein